MRPGSTPASREGSSAWMERNAAPARAFSMRNALRHGGHTSNTASSALRYFMRVSASSRHSISTLLQPAS